MDLLFRAALIVLSAAVGEAIIEFIFKPPIRRFMRGDARKEDREIIYNVLSALLGVGLAANFSLGFYAALGHPGNNPMVDVTLTGILIGRGSNWVHEFVSRYIEQKKLFPINEVFDTYVSF